MRFLLRLFQPEIEDLKRRLAFTELERDAARLERDNAVQKLAKAERDLKAEITAGRKRDEAFTARIVSILGVSPPAGRDTLVDKTETSSNDDADLSTDEEKALWDRAEEYLAQTKPGYSHQDIKETFEKMKKDPQHWLSNI